MPVILWWPSSRQIRSAERPHDLRAGGSCCGQRRRNSSSRRLVLPGAFESVVIDLFLAAGPNGNRFTTIHHREEGKYRGFAAKSLHHAKKHEVSVSSTENTEETGDNMTCDDILNKLDAIQSESAAYWGALNAPAFMRSSARHGRRPRTSGISRSPSGR